MSIELHQAKNAAENESENHTEISVERSNWPGPRGVGSACTFMCIHAACPSMYFTPSCVISDSDRAASPGGEPRLPGLRDGAGLLQPRQRPRPLGEHAATGAQAHQRVQAL